MENAYLYQLIALVLLVGVALFLFILPDSKKNKQLARDRAGIRPGDLVYTQNGLHGRVVQRNGDLVTVSCAPDGARLELALWGIVQVESKPEKA